jgi:integrase
MRQVKREGPAMKRKRLLEKAPVTGYQLFRLQDVRPDGSVTTYPNYYVRHNGKTTCLKIARLTDAKIKVKKMAGDEAQGKRRLDAPPVEVTVGTLLDLVTKDYAENGQRSHINGKIKNSLRPFFGDKLAASVDSDTMDRWKEWRVNRRLRKSSEDGRSTLKPSSINRELSILRRAYQLGYERKPQLVEKIPPIFKKFAENNIRKGFLSPDQYHTLMAQLPPHLLGITCVGYHLGNRKGELFQMEWSDVELDGDPPIVTLWPGETKNNDGRTLPLVSGEMLDTLRRLKAERDAKWPEATHVFLNGEGKPLTYHMMRKAWNDACSRAGVPGLLFHDLRRSAVRNSRRAGVTQNVARGMSGHKTDSVFNRYDITDFTDLRDAAAKVAQFHAQHQHQHQPPTPPQSMSDQR